MNNALPANEKVKIPNMKSFMLGLKTSRRVILDALDGLVSSIDIEVEALTRVLVKRSRPRSLRSIIKPGSRTTATEIAAENRQKMLHTIKMADKLVVGATMKPKAIPAVPPNPVTDCSRDNSLSQNSLLLDSTIIIWREGTLAA